MLHDTLDKVNDLDDDEFKKLQNTLGATDNQGVSILAMSIYSGDVSKYEYTSMSAWQDSITKKRVRSKNNKSL